MQILTFITEFYRKWLRNWIAFHQLLLKIIYVHHELEFYFGQNINYKLDKYNMIWNIRVFQNVFFSTPSLCTLEHPVCRVSKRSLKGPVWNLKSLIIIVFNRFWADSIRRQHLFKITSIQLKNKTERRMKKSIQRHKKETPPPPPPIQVINEDWCLKHRPEP